MRGSVVMLAAVTGRYSVSLGAEKDAVTGRAHLQPWLGRRKKKKKKERKKKRKKNLRLIQKLCPIGVT